MKHLVPFYPAVVQTKKEDFFRIGKDVGGGKIIPVKGRGFFEILKEVRGQNVHAHGRGFPFPELCSLFARKSIYSPINDTLGGKWWTRAVRRFVFNRYEKIICNTDFGRKNFIKGGIKPEKIVVIPNVVDYKFFSKTKGGNEFRKKFGIGRKEKFALSIGIRPLKNPDVIAKACELAGIKSVMVGPYDRGELEKAWKGKGFEWYLPPKDILNNENVVLTGQLQGKELLGALDAATIFVNSSNYETFGLAVYEAASSGLPLCLPNYPAFDIFRRCALFHNYRDQGQLAGNINKYLDNPRLMKSNARKSREIAKRFDYGTVSKQLEKLYKQTGML